MSFKSKTWYHFIPLKSRRLEITADSFLTLSNEISSIEKKLTDRKRELSDLEDELSQIIKIDNYSDNDIQYAKEKYQKYLNP